MKNVLVDMHRLKQNPFNGLYTFSYNLGQSLAALPADDIKLHFYLPKSMFGIFGDDALYEAHHSIDKFYMSGTARFDVWHATTTISWYKPFNSKTKFIFTIHDLNFLIEDAAKLKSNQNLLKKIQDRVSRADHLTFISNYAMEVARQYLQLGDKPCSVVYNGSNVNEFAGFDAPRYRPDKPFLFTIGLVQPRKNFHLLPALLKGNDYELVIAGLNHFDYRNEIEQQIKKWQVADRVKLVGAVTEEEKYWYYKNCVAFMFPSFAEGFGLPVLEAMHFGKPVFLSTQTCLPEIGGDVAYYFNSFEAEAMQKAFAEGMNNYQQDATIVTRIKQRAALFNWNNAAAQYMHIYSTV